jgi:hypothetical protein
MRIAFFLCIFTIICGYALWKGGAPERHVAVVFILGVVATTLLRQPFPNRFGSAEIGIFSTDVAMLAALVVIALNAERFWPIWISAFQLLQVFSHLADMFIPYLLPQTYMIIVSVWVYPMLALLAVGTIRHRTRIQLTGSDRSWSDFSRT